MEFIVVALIVGLVCGLISVSFAKESDQTLAFFLGLLLGPFGVLIAAILRR